MPHFLAIAWLYREDYARAGFVMLPNLDETGVVTGRQAVNYSFALLLVSLVPGVLGMAGPGYFLGAFVLGLGVVFCAVRMQLAPGRRHARQLFFASIIYLPLLLALLALGESRAGLNLHGSWTNRNCPKASRPAAMMKSTSRPRNRDVDRVAAPARGGR